MLAWVHEAGRAVTVTPGPRIRTPDQRLRVFVSSTLKDLAEERHAVQRAIQTLRLTPVMFEIGARPYPPRALYRSLSRAEPHLPGRLLAVVWVGGSRRGDLWP